MLTAVMHHNMQYIRTLETSDSFVTLGVVTTPDWMSFSSRHELFGCLDPAELESAMISCIESRVVHFCFGQSKAPNPRHIMMTTPKLMHNPSSAPAVLLELLPDLQELTPRA